MSVAIVHLSDLHFGDPKAVLNRHEVSRVLTALLTKSGPDTILVLSGDITFKGQQKGYDEANEAMLGALQKCGLASHRVIICPGNHDITKLDGRQSSFAAFDAWSASIRSDKHCTFAATTCRHFACESIDFLLLNSAYHGDITYGMVDLPRLDEVLGDMGTTSADGRVRVAVMHHHLIPISADENSATRNAHGVLSRLAKHGFAVVLHGHQHMLLSLNVGDSAMQVSGIGSFRYSTPGYVNSAAIHRINANRELFSEFFAVSKDSNDFLMPVNPNF